MISELNSAPACPEAADSSSHNINRVEPAIDDTLRLLGVGYLDLYHMHWPVADGWFGRKYIGPYTHG